MKKFYPTEGHEPIYPVTHAMHYSTGLNKREHFASLALQGMLANSNTTRLGINDMVKLSIKAADELIEQLNNPSNDTL